ncbi:MAG: hypothetical protein QW478_06085 [Candidatus Micrarchaeaceae archaeon]
MREVKELARMKELHRKGYSFYRIAKELGLSYAVVAYWIGDYKKRYRQRNKKVVK